MTSDELPDFWDEALEVLAAAPIAFLATSNQAQALVRAVTPTYEGATAYIATDPQSPKVRQILDNPLVDLMHWTSDFRHVNLRGRADMIDDEETKRRLWDLFAYNLADYFESDDKPPYGLMRIEPFRIEITSLQRAATGKPPKVWRSHASP